jgi:hypothetical protein
VGKREQKEQFLYINSTIRIILKMFTNAYAKKFSQFTRDFQHKHPRFCYISFLSIASTKFLNGPKCSGKPLNKESRIACQMGGKTPNNLDEPQMAQKSLDNKEKEGEGLRCTNQGELTKVRV